MPAAGRAIAVADEQRFTARQLPLRFDGFGHRCFFNRLDRERTVRDIDGFDERFVIIHVEMLMNEIDPEPVETVEFDKHVAHRAEAVLVGLRQGGGFGNVGDRCPLHRTSYKNRFHLHLPPANAL